MLWQHKRTQGFALEGFDCHDSARPPSPPSAGTVTPEQLLHHEGSVRWAVHIIICMVKLLLKNPLKSQHKS